MSMRELSSKLSQVIVLCSGCSENVAKMKDQVIWDIVDAGKQKAM
jgi:uncharacterized metal-binding protein